MRLFNLITFVLFQLFCWCMNLFISILWNWYHELFFFFLIFLCEVDSYVSGLQGSRDNLGPF